MPKFVLANSNLFIGSTDTTGTVKEFEIDNLKAQTENYESLGMLFNDEVPTGFQQMQGKLTFAGPTPATFGDAAFPWETTPATLLGVMTDKSFAGPAGNAQFRAQMTIRPMEIGLGRYQNQKLTEFERSFYIDTIKIEMGGVEKLFIDAKNNIYRVNGVDKWASYRTLLGQ